MESIRLTQTVQKGGCAAKVAASELRQILSQVQFPKPDENLLVDGELFDDAAIYRVSEDLALVQTLDFFTPIVDSPRLFGQIATANALSDVYAMGGRPKTGMAILAFPLAQLSRNVVVEVLQGACDKLKEARANFVGGHSIDDDTLKFGMSVTGYVHPDKAWSNKKAQDGDVLILTKALGTGTLTAALKKQEITEEKIKTALNSMAQLNNIIDFLNVELMESIHSATDITGFGLSGHSFQMAMASRKSFRIQMSNLVLFDQTQEFLEKKFLTKAHKSNEQYTLGKIKVDSLSPLQQLAIHDPQTSGGLLLSVAAGKSQQIISSLEKHFPCARIVGEVTEKTDFAVEFLS